MERSRTIRMALGGNANMADLFPPKPLRMRWTTFARLKAKADAADHMSLEVYAAKLDKWSPGWR